MNILFSQKAEESLKSLSRRDLDLIKIELERMKVERFPKIRALLGSDEAMDDGVMVRKKAQFRIYYKFLDKRNENSIIVIDIEKKR